MRLFLLIIMLTMIAGKVYSLPANFFVADQILYSDDSEPDPDEYVDADVKPDAENIRAQIEGYSIYPVIAKKANLEGIVVMQVLIDTNGSIRKVKFLSSSNEVFSKSAEEAAQNVKARPAMKGGKPIPFWMTIPVRFSLKKNSEVNLMSKKVEQSSEFVNYLAIRLTQKIETTHKNLGHRSVTGSITVSLTLESDGEIDDIEVLSTTSDYLKKLYPICLRI